MNTPATNTPSRSWFPNWKPVLGYVLLAVAALQLAYEIPALAWMTVFYLFGLLRLASVAATKRQAFYGGLLAGLGVFAPQLGFFWTLFSGGAVALWTVLAFWTGLFVLLTHLVRQKAGPGVAAVAAPWLWTGLEYFRSELYYLRFSWITPGLDFADSPLRPFLAGLGVYGIGFLVATMAAGLVLWRHPRGQGSGEATATSWLGRWASWILVSQAAVLLLLASVSGLRPVPEDSMSGPKTIHVAALQVESFSEDQMPRLLDELATKHPRAELVVLPEYTFQTPVPAEVRQWCRAHQKYLVAGGMEPVGDTNYYNTVFVVGPDGEVVFRQVKNVPIQFFKDGLPAKERAVWNSPWGKIGFPICYDFSYRRVVDDFIRAGAQALIVPTMDCIEWGERQHLLHARVAPMRAAEYDLPVFRVASSGISQLVERGGRVVATAPYPGQEEMLGGELKMGQPGRLPWDHWLAPGCVAVTGLVIVWLLLAGWNRPRMGRAMTAHSNTGV